MKFFTVLKTGFTFRVFEQLVLALKNRVCLEFTLLNIYFLSVSILNNLHLPWKTEFTLKFFTVLKYFLSFRIFEQLELTLNFLSLGGRLPPLQPLPRMPLHLSILLTVVAFSKGPTRKVLPDLYICTMSKVSFYQFYLDNNTKIYLRLKQRARRRKYQVSPSTRKECPTKLGVMYR